MTTDLAESIPGSSEFRGAELSGIPAFLQHFWSRYSSQIVFWAAFMTSTACAFIRERSLFSVGRYAWGDSAVNSLLVVKAEHLRELTGNYSRVGFHHPGPALIYMLTGGEVLFKDILHIVPAPYNGQLLGVSVYVALFLSLSVMMLYRLTNSLAIAGIAFGLGFMFAVRQNLFANDWFPILYMSAFLLFVVASAGLAAGRTSALPWYVLAAGTLAHGHVSFLLFVGVTTVIAATSWFFLHRGFLAREAKDHRASLYVAAAFVALFLLPMVLEVALHFPGPWHQYWYYVGHTKVPHRSFSQIIHYEWHYWKDLHFPVAVYPIAVAAGIGFTLSERDRGIRRLFIAVYGVLVLETGLTFYYLLRGVDILTPESVYGYVGYFYEAVPLVLLIAAASQLWLRFSRSVTQVHHPMVYRGGAIFAAVLVIAATVLGATNSALGRLPDSQSNVVAAVNAIRQSPDRGTRPIALVEDSLSDWPAAAEIGLQMQRAGVRWCLWKTTPMDVVLYTPSFVCSSRQDHRWQLHVSGAAPPSSSRVIWQGVLGNDPNAVVYAIK